MSPHTIEKLTNLQFLITHKFNELGNNVFHIWDSSIKRPVSGVPSVTPNVMRNGVNKPCGVK